MKKQRIARVLPETPVSAIRRTQAAISRDYRIDRIADYYNRDTVGAVAEGLVAHYFPQTIERQNTMHIGMLEEAYRAALLLYPLHYRLRGTYKPDWTTATTLSWFRRAISEQSRQWFYTVTNLDTASDIDGIVVNVQRYAGVRDAVGTKLVIDSAHNLMQTSGRKAAFAELILDPFAGAHVDARLGAALGFHATPTERRRRRARKQGTASYLRRSCTAWIIGDRDTVRNHPDFDWQDIRVTPIAYGDYRLSWHAHKRRPGGAVNVQVNQHALDAVYRECREITRGRANPRRKAAAIAATATKYIRQYRHAAGSLLALQRLDAQIGALVRKRVTSADSGATYKAGQVQVRSALTLPIRHPFADPVEVCPATWLALFSPYR